MVRFVASAPLNDVNMEELIQSAVVGELRTSYNNRNIIFLKYLFNGHATLLLFYARSVFEAEHMRGLALMDRNKVTHLRKEIRISLEDCKYFFIL